jgi:hypothetical protein
MNASHEGSLCASKTMQRCRQMMLDEALESLMDVLKDPTSARIAPQFVVTRDGVVCGMVNAKNGYGGYTGKKLLVYWAKAGAGSFFPEDQRNSLDWTAMQAEATRRCTDGAGLENMMGIPAKYRKYIDRP